MDQAQVAEIQAMQDPGAKIDKLVELLQTSHQTIQGLQGQVQTLQAAAGDQNPITMDREWLWTRSYTQKVNTPKLEVGTTFDMYKFNVRCWQRTVEGQLSKKAQATLLVTNLPDSDKYGGLKRIIVEKLSWAKIEVDDGVDNVLDALDTILRSPSFIRLISWNKRWEKLDQGSQNFDKHVLTIRQMVKMAEEDFGITIPSKLIAAKLLSSCSNITPENVGSITNGLDLTTGEDAKLDEKLEVKLRQYSSTVLSLGGAEIGGARKDENKVHFVEQDVFGNRIGDDADVLHNERYKIPRETPDERRARCMRDGTCFKCNSKEHISYNCPKRRKPAEAQGAASGQGQGQGGQRQNSGPPPKKVNLITFGPGPSGRSRDREPQVEIHYEDGPSDSSTSGTSEPVSSTSRGYYTRNVTEDRGAVQVQIQQGAAHQGAGQAQAQRGAAHQGAGQAQDPNILQLHPSEDDLLPDDNLFDEEEFRGTKRTWRNERKTFLTWAVSEEDPEETEEKPKKELQTKLDTHWASEARRTRGQLWPITERLAVIPEELYDDSSDEEDSWSTKVNCSSDDTSDYTTDVEDVFLVNRSYKEVLLNKSKIKSNLCILDSGCERECAGSRWTQEFIDNLSLEDQAKVEKVHDSQKFRFGDGQVKSSQYSVKVPIYVGGVRYFMAWSVLDLDLPLLMSLPVMQRLNLTIKYSRRQGQVCDKAWVGGKCIRLHYIEGHQWMALDRQGSLEDVIQGQEEPMDSETEVQ